MRNTDNLDISDARLVDDDIKLLARNIHRSEALNWKTVNVIGNFFGGAAAAALLKALAIFAFSLRELRIPEASIDTAEAREALEFLRESKPHVRLIHSNNHGKREVNHPRVLKIRSNHSDIGPE